MGPLPGSGLPHGHVLQPPGQLQVHRAGGQQQGLHPHAARGGVLRRGLLVRWVHGVRALHQRGLRGGRRAAHLRGDARTRLALPLLLPRQPELHQGPQQCHRVLPDAVHRDWHAGGCGERHLADVRARGRAAPLVERLRRPRRLPPRRGAVRDDERLPRRLPRQLQLPGPVRGLQVRVLPRAQRGLLRDAGVPERLQRARGVQGGGLRRRGHVLRLLRRLLRPGLLRQGVPAGLLRLRRRLQRQRRVRGVLLQQGGLRLHEPHRGPRGRLGVLRRRVCGGCAHLRAGGVRRRAAGGEPAGGAPVLRRHLGLRGGHLAAVFALHGRRARALRGACAQLAVPQLPASVRPPQRHRRRGDGVRVQVRGHEPELLDQDGLLGRDTLCKAGAVLRRRGDGGLVRVGGDGMDFPYSRSLPRPLLLHSHV
mmetsp:Transcript_37608/g.70547  ORF Transcript_37608/g.70547 Transcript_37608/m.70547 type:complete len:423 (+) Transcript_37608:1392-2660(+)